MASTKALLGASRLSIRQKPTFPASKSLLARTITSLGARTCRLTARNESPITHVRTRTASTNQCRRLASAAESQVTLAKTALYDLHVKHGGKMVPFGGFSMPVQYADLSIGASHSWTREKASLFDVSHMLQHELSGPGAEAFLSYVTPSSIKTLKRNHSTLSLLLNENGGIVDDTVITRLGDDRFYFVTNAGCRAKDIEYIGSQLESFLRRNPKERIDWKRLEGKGLVALQGPRAAGVLSAVLSPSHSDKLSSLYFGQCGELDIVTQSNGAVTVLASRGGYTGEDGFELSIPDAASTVAVTETLLECAGPDTLRLAGLGPRDSLRLEAGMCLYGHDLNDSTTPFEGSLAWVVGKDRRTEGGFLGAETVLWQLNPKHVDMKGRRRVGFVVDGAPAREGAVMEDEGGAEVGVVTSGCPSPTLGKNIAMGYVMTGLHKSGTELYAVVRGKKRRAVVTKMPFVPTRYHKPPPA